MTTMREALETAMRHSNPDEAMAALQADGVTIATQDSMTQAIHDVYCGVMADHTHPNDKDREQAAALLASLGRQA
jgi:hypothetical protein